MLSHQAEITIRKWYSNSCCIGETANCVSWVNRMGFGHRQKKAVASGNKIAALSQTKTFWVSQQLLELWIWL